MQRWCGPTSSSSLRRGSAVVSVCPLFVIVDVQCLKREFDSAAVFGVDLNVHGKECATHRSYSPRAAASTPDDTDVMREATSVRMGAR
jgi:hypothetical protein